MRARTGVRKIRQILEKYFTNIKGIFGKNLQNYTQKIDDYYIKRDQINSDFKKVRK